MKKVVLLFVFLLLGSLLAEEVPKNIILMIGDGLAVPHVTAARIAKGESAMEQLENIGLMATHSASHLVTDSAAAVTAMATGTKTRNGALGVDVNNQPLETVAEVARDKGKAVGLVASCSLTHATPAGFAAHVPSRKMDLEIAQQIVDADFDVLFGGGWAWFVPKPQETNDLAEAMGKSPAGYGKLKTSKGERLDGQDLLEELRKSMPVAETAEEFYKLGETDRAAALLYSLHPPRSIERKVPLADQTAKALEILSRDDDGFFLMVEGAQIDWAGHANDADWVMEETLDFDDAVQKALEFIENNPDTLLIVTSDHECGGYAIHDGSIEESTLTRSGFTWGKHTGTLVPIFSQGPGSDVFGRVIDNTEMGRILKRYAVGKPAE